ncbi:hypothetical protein D8674_019899 [Pyrus ussuriensis x Pyrus communis]|uniref:Uncharacterized protein n=1 Tax=Pyrus ussuriensis x Pyrus communis TaxID=2448454 RepID=A0A5N5G9J3_9ROSA|nr:hypothetical protein D8674_019899 [Pyrus ussuriensis x Pyrus communis]
MHRLLYPLTGGEPLLLTESLFSQTSEFVKLDFSKSKVTSNYIHRLSTDSSMICGIVELNLSENPITKKCELGTAGILRIIKALSGNGCLEELNLAENANVETQNSESTPDPFCTKGS